MLALNVPLCLRLLLIIWSMDSMTQFYASSEDLICIILPTDRVKIVYHPEFLSSNNPVLGMEYEDFVRGCHLGVFPSSLWALGIHTCWMHPDGHSFHYNKLIRFGSFIEDTVECPSDYGIYICRSQNEICRRVLQSISWFHVWILPKIT